MNSIYKKTDLTGYDGTNTLEHFEVIRGQSRGRFCESPVEFTEQLVYVDIDKVKKTAKINTAKKTAYDTARQTAIDTKEAYLASVQPRKQRKIAYITEMGENANAIQAGVVPDPLEAIGDCMDALFEFIEANRTSFTIPEKLDVLLTKRADIKARIPL